MLWYLYNCDAVLKEAAPRVVQLMAIVWKEAASQSLGQV